MCTVSYIYSDNQIIITSNRDEKIARPKSMIPKCYSGIYKKLFFPKDQKAGGTWYMIDDKGNVIVLLNGASEKHIVKEKYRKSRGLILLDIFDSKQCIEKWLTIDLKNIEPFTLVLYYDKKLYQLRWNGEIKEKIILDPKQNYIWSSSTLYPLEIRKEREQLFTEFISAKEKVTALDSLNFHQYGKSDDLHNGFVMNRNDTLMTLSITQTCIIKNKMEFIHKDLIENKTYTNNFLLL